jgi:hypothetical protein
MTKYAVLINPNPYQWNSGEKIFTTDSKEEAEYNYNNWKEHINRGDTEKVSLIQYEEIDSVVASRELLQKHGSRD